MEGISCEENSPVKHNCRDSEKQHKYGEIPGVAAILREWNELNVISNDKVSFAADKTDYFLQDVVRNESNDSCDVSVSAQHKEEIWRSVQPEDMSLQPVVVISRLPVDSKAETFSKRHKLNSSNPVCGNRNDEVTTVATTTVCRPVSVKLVSLSPSVVQRLKKQYKLSSVNLSWPNHISAVCDMQKRSQFSNWSWATQHHPKKAIKIEIDEGNEDVNNFAPFRMKTQLMLSESSKTRKIIKPGHVNGDACIDQADDIYCRNNKKTTWKVKLHDWSRKGSTQHIRRGIKPSWTNCGQRKAYCKKLIKQFSGSNHKYRDLMRNMKCVFCGKSEFDSAEKLRQHSKCCSFNTVDSSSKSLSSTTQPVSDTAAEGHGKIIPRKESVMDKMPSEKLNALELSFPVIRPTTLSSDEDMDIKPVITPVEYDNLEQKLVDEDVALTSSANHWTDGYAAQTEIYVGRDEQREVEPFLQDVDQSSEADDLDTLPSVDQMMTRTEIMEDLASCEEADLPLNGNAESASVTSNACSLTSDGNSIQVHGDDDGRESNIDERHHRFGSRATVKNEEADIKPNLTANQAQNATKSLRCPFCKCKNKY